MKAIMTAIAVLGLGAFYFAMNGCANTEQPGTSFALGDYTTNVDSTPDKVTDAANKACQDLKLADITSVGTKVDGKVTAHNAAGDQVAISIEQNGDNVSKVTVHIGATGDEAVSRQIVDKIKSHLSSIFG